MPPSNQRERWCLSQTTEYKSDPITNYQLPFTNNMELPYWLTKKQLYVAQQLIDQGFHYCGNANEFCEPDFSVPVIDGWTLSFPPGECFLDATCDQALFTKNLEGREFNFQAELKAVKKLIRTASKEWECVGLNHHQLVLF